MNTEGPRLLICGDRNWNNKELIKLFVESYAPSLVIEGEARGADSLGRDVAQELGIPVLKFPANWTEHGKAAGPIRNQQMLKEGKPTLVLGFHNDIEASKGTKHMLSIAVKAKIKTILVTEVNGDTILYKGE